MTDDRQLNQPVGGVLSSREREVLAGLARGESGAELASRLFVAPGTIRRHVANSREKLGARSRVHAVAIALDRGEIDPLAGQAGEQRSD